MEEIKCKDRQEKQKEPNRMKEKYGIMFIGFERKGRERAIKHDRRHTRKSINGWVNRWMVGWMDGFNGIWRKLEHIFYSKNRGPKKWISKLTHGMIFIKTSIVGVHLMRLLHRYILNHCLVH